MNPELPLRVCLAVCYASIAAELLTVAVPSTVSSRQIVRRGCAEPDSGPATPGGRLRLLLGFGGATALALAAYSLPLVWVATPAWAQRWLLLLPAGLPLVRTGVAAGLMLAGRALTFISVRQLRVAWGGTTDGALAISGLFSRMRNPGLSGMFLVYVGVLVGLPSLVLAAAGLVYIVHMHSRVLLEERHLLHRFGDAYRRYLTRSGRYLPAVGHGRPAGAAEARR